MRQLMAKSSNGVSERPNVPKIIEKILSCFSGKRIFIDDKPYLTRYYLIGNGDGSKMEVYLHHIQAIDDFRWLHNHPWPWFLSLVVRGTYVQDVSTLGKTPTKSKHIRWFNLFRGQDRYHAIRSLPKGHAWSLVVVPPKNNVAWGYWDLRAQCHIPDDSIVNHYSTTVLFGTKKIVD